MDQNIFHNQNINYKSETSKPPPRLLPVLQKLKEAYLVWYNYYSIIPKIHRYSLGEKIDKLDDKIETIYNYMGKAEARSINIENILFQDHRPRIRTLEKAVGV